MKKQGHLIALIIFTLAVTAQNMSAQDFSSEIPARLKQLEAEKSSQSEEVSINTKMIEKFYRIYDEVEVVSWKQMLNERGYDSTLAYMQAYRDINLNEIDASNLNAELEQSVNDRANELKKALYRNQPITTVDNIESDQPHVSNNL